MKRQPITREQYVAELDSYVARGILGDPNALGTLRAVVESRYYRDPPAGSALHHVDDAVLASAALLARTRILRTLQGEAKVKAKAYGHDLGWFSVDDGPYATRFVLHAKCTRCGAEARVNAFPAPNQVDVWGEAVAHPCEKGSS